MIGGISDSSSDSDMISPDSGILSPGILPPDMQPSPAHARSYGKARKTKGIEPFYKGFEGRGVVYLAGDIN